MKIGITYTVSCYSCWRWIDTRPLAAGCQLADSSASLRIEAQAERHSDADSADRYYRTLGDSKRHDIDAAIRRREGLAAAFAVPAKSTHLKHTEGGALGSCLPLSRQYAGRGLGTIGAIGRETERLRALSCCFKKGVSRSSRNRMIPLRQNLEFGWSVRYTF
jgi:hypothetical protein